MRLFDIIRRPLITEKGNLLKELNRQYTFEVGSGTNKNQIKKAVEAVFKVHVSAVKTIGVRGKMRRVGRSSGKRSNWKKAIVTIKEGEKIELFEGV